MKKQKAAYVSIWKELNKISKLFNIFMGYNLRIIILR